MRPIRILLPSILVLLGTVALAEVLGEPVRITSSPASELALAYMTSGPLVVWRDEEAGSVTAKAVNGSGQEHLVTGGAKHMAVAAIGQRGLAVWTQASGAVMAVRLTSDGAPSGAVVRLASNAAGSVTVAASRDRYLVAWTSTLDDVYAAVLDPSAGIQIPAMPITTQGLQSIDALNAASNGDGFAVVWHQWSARRVAAVTLDANGIPTSMTPILVGEDGFLPDVTSDGSTYFVAWGATPGIAGRALAPDGTVGRRVTVTTEEDVFPHIAWDGSAYDAAFARTARPRPGFAIPFLVAQRFRASGAYLGNLGAPGLLFPTAWDLGARDGRIDLVAVTSDGVTLQTANVTTPPVRSRAARH